MSRIFLSHSSKDAAQAMAVKAWMAEQGWDDVFLDLDPEGGLVVGERWQEALKQAASRCELVVFLISPDWAKSRWCLAEFLLARQLNKRIFGVIIAPTPEDDLPVELRAEWQMVDLTVGAPDYRVEVRPPPGDAAVEVAFAGDGLMRLRAGMLSAGLDAGYFAWPPEDDPDRSPYPGLKPLEAADAGIFFGRDGAIVDALDRLRGLKDAAPPRMFVILGASGAGKSSFMRAGLLPRLARDDRHFLPLPPVRPGRAVLTGDSGFVACLDAALRAAGKRRARADILAAVEAGGDALAALLAEIASAADGAPTILLPIDQGEELFQADGAEEAARFLAALHGLLATDAPPLLALLTIRSDSYEPLQTAPALADVAQQTFSLPPLAQGAYSQVIEGPPRRLAGEDRALTVEQALVDALLADMAEGGAKDALPLLAFTLERLYRDYGGDGALKLADYEALGRARGSIEAAVEQALAAADGDGRIPRDRRARLALLRRGLIPWLAGIDPETGAPRRRVARLSAIPEEARPLIELLIEQRLLATDVDPASGETTVEPAHEALLRQWTLLEDWLEEDFEDLSTAEALKRAARDWEANARDAEWLGHAGGRLEEAERVAARPDFDRLFEAPDRAYLAAARQAEEARHRLEAERQAAELAAARTVARRTRIGLVASLLLAAVAGVTGYMALQSQERAEAEAALKTTALEQAARESARKNQALADAHQERERAITATAVAEERRVRAEIDESRLSSAIAGQLLNQKRFVESVIVARRTIPRNLNNPDRAFAPNALATLSASIHGLMGKPSVLRGHRGRILHAAFSPDGTRIVTTSQDRTARIWDADGCLVHVLKGHGSPVLHAAFSPDSRHIVTISQDRTARVWGADGRLVHVLEGHDGIANHAVFSPDGAHILTASGNTARIWRADGSLIHILEGHSRRVLHAAFSPDGDHIITSSVDGTARIWSVDGRLAHVLDGHRGPVSHATFSPDGARILTASGDGTARIWSVDGRLAHVLDGHRGPVSHATFSPDGARILTASGDRTARLWHTDGRLVTVLEGHSRRVLHSAFSPDSGRIVTASADGTARLWNADGRLVQILEGHGAPIDRVAVSPDGAQILTASVDETARLWNADGRPAHILKGHDGPVVHSTFSPDSRRIVTASSDGTARIWSANGRMIRSLEGHGGPVVHAMFSPDGTRILTASGDGTARTWGADGHPAHILNGHSGPVTHATFSPDGTRIITTSQDRTARIWSAGGRLAHILEGHVGPVLHAAFSPDSKRIVTASRDETARIWSADGRLIHVLEGHRSGVRHAFFSPRGEHIVTVSSAGKARIWSADGRLVHALESGRSIVLHATFSPDGARIVTTSLSGTARTWSADGRLIHTLEGHRSMVRHAAFSTDGGRIVTASDDETARIWSVDGRLIHILEDDGGLVLHAAFSPDGTRIATASSLGTVHIGWSPPETGQALVDLAHKLILGELASEQEHRIFGGIE